MRKEQILVVEDEKGMRQYLEKLLIRNNYEVVLTANGQEAIDFVKTDIPDLILTDIKMPKMDGIEFLEKVKKIYAQIPVVMMTAHGTMENAIKAMKLGAYDYVNKPFDIDEILIVIDKALERKRLEDENQVLRQELKNSYTFEDIVSKSERMKNIFETIKSIADAKTHILIQGETGTGKELVARAIHHLGLKKDMPFVPVDCAALTESLLESELFGHVKGAFTGATQDKQGLFEMANGGTVFLDEIGHISMDIQAKLLRFLQDGVIKRVGDVKSKKVDVRLIAAANEDLQEAVKNGSFREDLFFRINVVMIEIPSLRERKEDIPLLLEHFIEKYNHIEKKQLEGISEDAMNILMNYDWPGNVREVENFVHRAVVIKKTPLVFPKDIPINMSKVSMAEKRDVVERTMDFAKAKKNAVEVFEKRFLIDMLKRFEGNVSHIAREVNLDRRNLQRKFKTYGINPRDYS
jgi:DNA-binding NtrC family response regulator